MYEVGSMKIPPLILEGLNQYGQKGIRPGEFVRACLANDFMMAVVWADPNSLECIRDIAHYIHNEMPGTCHGSYEKVYGWIEKHRTGELNSDAK